MIPQRFFTTPPPTYKVTYFNNKMDTDPRNAELELTWAEIVALYENVRLCEEKYDVPQILPGYFKPEEQWELTHSDEFAELFSSNSYRNSKNVDAISVLIIDLDEAGAREAAERVFSDHEYLLHSSHSYCSEKSDRFRMVLPLETPIPGAVWKDFYSSLNAIIHCDESCFDLARLYLLPSHNPKSDLDPVFIRNKGKLLTRAFLLNLDQRRDDIRRIRTQDAMVSDSIGGNQSDGNHGQYQSYQYESLCDRHKNAIEQHLLSYERQGFKAHRNAYAYAVFQKEFAKAGVFIDLEATIEFIYLSVQENTRLPLHVGNTHEEMGYLVAKGLANKGINIKHESISGQLKRIPSMVSRAMEFSRSGKGWKIKKSLTSGQSMRPPETSLNQSTELNRWLDEKYRPNCPLPDISVVITEILDRFITYSDIKNGEYLEDIAALMVWHVNKAAPNLLPESFDMMALVNKIQSTDKPAAPNP